MLKRLNVEIQKSHIIASAKYKERGVYFCDRLILMFIKILANLLCVIL